MRWPRIQESPSGTGGHFRYAPTGLGMDFSQPGKIVFVWVEIGPKNITLHELSHGRLHLRLRCAATLIRPGLLWKMYRAFAIRIVGTRQIGCEARPSQNEPCGAAWATRCRFHAPIEIPQEQVSNTGIPVERSGGENYRGKVPGLKMERFGGGICSGP